MRNVKKVYGDCNKNSAWTFGYHFADRHTSELLTPQAVKQCGTAHVMHVPASEVHVCVADFVLLLFVVRPTTGQSPSREYSR